MQFVIVGTGGQGILFASKALGHIAMEKGRSVVGSEVHGMAQRGGSVVSHFKVGEYLSPLVKVGEADVLLAFDQNEAVRNLHYLRDGGTLVVNLYDPKAFQNDRLQSSLDRRKIEVHPIEGYSILKEHMGGRFLFLNVLILGAMCGAGVGGVSVDEMNQAISDLAPPRFVEENLKVLKLGHEAAR
ncbi:pyruvate ferredoxin/flavodoxin oxidoreductase [Dethiosulfovibrio peptidovorans DSM 11002]|uniref:Pyruvate ferredoxin/flavodoxin oxidoreductase n=1 Tax=Dethiosulfovibrio peptidovorans DSM 11002 TaxID=469381 RepID=D2Z3P8_9BACT|nr:2-oxoacid:acceptor oxidoreductase family protein [Dethiosulfovibrio peptidovorans]EFC90354.1 pyruvate ferredoxin/flavodoxin oxidoreductase [Dethiosulfovibrio peptidovorans DSM 11002]